MVNPEVFDMLEISRPDGLGDLGNLHLTLAEAHQLLACVQQDIVAKTAGTVKLPSVG